MGRACMESEKQQAAELCGLLKEYVSRSVRARNLCAQNEGIMSRRPSSARGVSAVRSGVFLCL